MAPLFGLSCPSRSKDSPKRPRASDGDARGGASLFDGTSKGTESPRAAADDGPMHRAGEMLERAFERMEGPTRTGAWTCGGAWRPRCHPFWRGRISMRLHKSEVWPNGVSIIGRWGCRSCPGRADPRHPVNLFLESCEKARTSGRGGTTAQCPTPAMGSGGKRLRRSPGPGARHARSAPTGRDGVLSRRDHEQDAPHVQRQVLAGLETWVAARPQEAGSPVREQNVVEEIARLRAAVLRRTGGTQGRGERRDRCPNDSKGGGHDPQEEGKSEA